MKLMKTAIRIVFVLLCILLLFAVYWIAYSYLAELKTINTNENQMFFLIGLPITFIAWPIGIFKAIKEKDEPTKYGIRFWGAIKNMPDYFGLFTYALVCLIFLSFMLGSEDLGILSVLLVFYYESLLILGSSILEKERII